MFQYLIESKCITNNIDKVFNPLFQSCSQLFMGKNVKGQSIVENTVKQKTSKQTKKTWELKYFLFNSSLKYIKNEEVPSGDKQAYGWKILH